MLTNEEILYIFHLPNYSNFASLMFLRVGVVTLNDPFWGTKIPRIFFDIVSPLIPRRKVFIIAVTIIPTVCVICTYLVMSKRSCAAV